MAGGFLVGMLYLWEGSSIRENRHTKMKNGMDLVCFLTESRLQGDQNHGKQASMRSKPRKAGFTEGIGKSNCRKPVCLYNLYKYFTRKLALTTCEC